MDGLIVLAGLIIFCSILWIRSRCPKCRGKMTGRLRGGIVYGPFTAVAAQDKIWTCVKCGHSYVCRAEMF